jgi:hypothetical protein
MFQSILYSIKALSNNMFFHIKAVCYTLFFHIKALYIVFQNHIKADLQAGMPSKEHTGPTEKAPQGDHQGSNHT